MSSRPSAFSFQLIPAFTPTLNIELSGGNVVVSSLDHDGAVIPGTRFQVTPAAADWSYFWTAVEFLEVWSWNQNYDVSGGRDGQAWKLHLKHGDRSLATQGSNGYPAFDSAARVSESEDRLGLFLFSLSQLLAHKSRPKGGVQLLQDLVRRGQVR